jgi:hypothetical protein
MGANYMPRDFSLKTVVTSPTLPLSKENEMNKICLLMASFLFGVTALASEVVAAKTVVVKGANAMKLYVAVEAVLPAQCDTGACITRVKEALVSTFGPGFVADVAHDDGTGVLVRETVTGAKAKALYSALGKSLKPDCSTDGETKTCTFFASTIVCELKAAKAKCLISLPAGQ